MSELLHRGGPFATARLLLDACVVESRVWAELDRELADRDEREAEAQPDPASASRVTHCESEERA